MSFKLLICAGFLSGAGGSEGALQHLHNFQKGVGTTEAVKVDDAISKK